MASVKQLKKDLNNDIGDLIEDIYIWELSNPDADLSKSEKLIEDSIKAFDDIIVKINAVSGENIKSQFKGIEKDKKQVLSDLHKKSEKL
jgi:hypothetical protein